MNMRIETIDYAVMVDELAELKASIAPLQEREATLKDLFKEGGRDRYDGTGHTAVVVLSERDSLDTKRLRADLGEELYLSYCSKTSVTAVRLTARKTH
jgi:hypothetical protein